MIGDLLALPVPMQSANILALPLLGFQFLPFLAHRGWHWCCIYINEFPTIDHLTHEFLEHPQRTCSKERGSTHPDPDKLLVEAGRSHHVVKTSHFRLEFPRSRWRKWAEDGAGLFRHDDSPVQRWGVVLVGFGAGMKGALTATDAHTDQPTDIELTRNSKEFS